MPKLKIDQREVEVAEGVTVLEAARRAGVEIPTLCSREGLPHFTSCMVCVVKEAASGKMIPSCSAAVAEGMDIRTGSDEVREHRRAALELLLSDHLGDCEGPCERVCPAHMDIPLMIRCIAAGRLAEALATVKRDIALPAVLGRICPAPCENGCRRRQIDKPVSICLLKRYVADVDLALDRPYRPALPESTGKTVAIVGGGPTGLAAAYYLARRGHACTVFDAGPAPGGKLRSDVPEEALPREVLDAEIETVSALGVALRAGVAVGADPTLASLRESHDAVVLAFGQAAGLGEELGVEVTKRGVKIQSRTFETSLPGVFAGGGAVAPCKIAVRAVGEGKDLACSVDQWLRGRPVEGPPRPFNSVVGKLRDEEKPVYLREADARERIDPAGGTTGGFSEEEARSEAERCLHCDCRKRVSCRLREYGTEYGTNQKRYPPAQRRTFEQRKDHPRIVFEQGKCISCGLCIRLAEARGEALGLSFVGRGIATRIGVPFGEALERALTVAGDECVAACPTGALAYAQGEDADLLQLNQ